MKCLGLLGADTVDATAVYGALLTGEMRHRFGHGAGVRLVMLNLNTPELAAALTKEDFGVAYDQLRLGAGQLVSLGATAIVACTSRLQPMAGHLTADVPLLSMTDAVGTALQTLKIKRGGLIGTASPSEEKHWRKCLAHYQVIDLFVPVPRDREHLAHLTTEELELGVVIQTTRADVGRIVYSLRQAGARAIVLTAPALGLAISHLDPVLPVLDATELTGPWRVGSA